MAAEPLTLGLAFILAHPALGHALVALALMAIATPALRFARAPNGPWIAATGVSCFFYGREALEAERFLLPRQGDPAAFFMAFWPGTWTGGGANVVEWLAPTATALALAVLTARRGRPGRELRLHPSRSSHPLSFPAGASRADPESAPAVDGFPSPPLRSGRE